MAIESYKQIYIFPLFHYLIFEYSTALFFTDFSPLPAADLALIAIFLLFLNDVFEDDVIKK